MSRPQMSTIAVGWFLDNINRAFASMADEELNNVSETLNEEMDKRQAFELRQAGVLEEEEVAGMHFAQGSSSGRPGRGRSQPPPGGEDGNEDKDAGNEPGSRARSRSKAITRRRAQDRVDAVACLPGRQSRLGPRRDRRIRTASELNRAI